MTPSCSEWQQKPLFFPFKMEILQFLSCSFITSQTTASFSTAALQDPYSAYQGQCFTAAYKLIFHPNSNSNWSHLQPLAQASCQKQQKLGKSTANSLRPIVLTVIQSLSKYGSQQHAMSSLVILPHSSLAAVRCSAYARIKAANFCERAVPAPYLMDQVKVVNTFLGYGEVSRDQGH